MSGNDPIQIDLAAIQKEVSALSPEKLREQLLSMRVRQKVQQKKQQGKGKQKEYQAKQRAKFLEMKQAAMAAGIWDQINEEAEAQAEAKLVEAAEPDVVEAE